MYCALSEEGARAEARARRGPDDAWRLKHLVRVADLTVVDLRDPAVVAELSVALTDLVGDWAAARPLTTRARKLGARGMIVPSAAAPGEWNLVIFPEGFDRVTSLSEEPWQPKLPSQPAPDH
jgi:RES domain-containing protein